MNDDEKRPDVTSLVPRGHSTTVNTSELVKVMQDLAAPWAEAEKAKHEAAARREDEETKRQSLDAQTTRWAIVAATVVFVGVLVIAGLALFNDAKDIAEKVIVALIAGASGFIAGRGSAKAK